MPTRSVTRRSPFGPKLHHDDDRDDRLGPRLAGFGALALLGALVGCFTGDGLLGQPCHTDDDCNVVANAFGADISCQDGICGAVCGDGVVIPAVEQCDDSNNDDADACVNCRKAVCGDDATRAGVEECDDGNDIDTDACFGCKAAYCGDGIVWAEKEACDDANDKDDDACVDCRLVACGDGEVNPATEACDDANADDDDGCTAQCRMGAERLSRGMFAFHTCAVRRGTIRCWGLSDFGQLGYENTAIVGDEPSDLPPAEVEVGGPVEDVVTGWHYTCVLLATAGDNVRCWGSNGENLNPGLPQYCGDSFDPCVYGDNQGEMPPSPLALGGRAVQITMGDSHACVVLVDGAVRCWGLHLEGSFQFPAPARQVAAGLNHSCVLLADGSVRCWGSNTAGQLGYGDYLDVLDPVDAGPVPLPGPARQVVTGTDHTCALLMDGGIYCWGWAQSGQLGNTLDQGPFVNMPQYIDPIHLGGQATQIDAGSEHTCAVLTDGTVRCWGSYVGGRLGYGNLEFVDPNAIPPVEIGGRALQVIAAADHTCALLVGGIVRCWGGNGGKLGLGHTHNIGDEPGEMPPPPVALFEAP